MNQANVTKLMSELRYNVGRRKKLSQVGGLEARLLKMKKTVTALIKYERIELNYPRGDEARGYAERLISDAIRHGDTHTETIQNADYYLLEKQLVHKLFKVLVPRFENYSSSYTKMFRAPKTYPGDNFDRCVLELRGNPFPPLIPDMTNNRNLIHNVLLDAAKQEYRQQKYEELAKNVSEDQGPVLSEAQPLPENTQKEKTES